MRSLPSDDVWTRRRAVGWGLCVVLLAALSSSCARKTEPSAEVDAGSSGATSGSSGATTDGGDTSTNGGGTNTAEPSRDAGAGGATPATPSGGTTSLDASGGTGDDADALDADALDAIPSGCEILAGRGEAECQGVPCEQARTEPPRKRAYALNLARYETTSDGSRTTLDDEELERRGECLRAWLTNLGLEASGSSRYPSTTGTWDELRVVALSAVLDSFTPTCRDALCDDCFGVSEDECNADAFCAVTEGRRIDMARECLGPEEFAYCTPFGRNCGAAFTEASLDGECWEFRNYCDDVPGLTNDDPDCRRPEPAAACAEP